MKRPIEDGLSLLIGAGIGVGLMYLLDPDSGSKRRHYLSKMSGDALGNTGSRLSDAWESVADTARAAGNSLSARTSRAASNIDPRAARNAGKRLHRRGLHLLSSASDMVSSASDSISDTRDSMLSRFRGAKRSAQSVADRAASSLGYEREDSHFVGQGICALSSLALGAGLWYLFDPRLGRSRRSWLYDKAGRIVHETGDFLRVSGRYVSDKMHGVASETRSHLMNPPVTDEKLREHIRAKLGHWIEHAGAVDVNVTKGRVTLRGTIPSTEIAKACSGVMGLRGVTDVDNQLMGGDPSLATSSGSGQSMPTSL
jgi:osmotically-inducible protein OsmY